MARYQYRCELHGEFDVFFPMGEAPETAMCITTVHDPRMECYIPAKRVYSFNFQEDRRRMRQGVSPATGKPFAESRAQERAIEKADGIVFGSKKDLLPHEREAIAYSKHVATGGDRVEMPVSVPQEPSKPLREYMREMNYKRHEFPAESFSREHQERQLKELVAEAERA